MRHGRQVVKQRPKNAKQQSKISIKWKMNQQFMKTFRVKPNIYIVSHAKNQSHKPSESMEN